MHGSGALRSTKPGDWGIWSQRVGVHQARGVRCAGLGGYTRSLGTGIHRARGFGGHKAGKPEHMEPGGRARALGCTEPGVRVYRPREPECTEPGHVGAHRTGGSGCIELECEALKAGRFRHADPRNWGAQSQ